MKFIYNKGNTDPKINLALEEYALRNIKSEEDLLIFYINEPSIILGKNQNAFEEINHRYVAENEIEVIRRISGGGTVYHDLGNLNFSFITNYNPKYFNNYEHFNTPIIKAMNKLGIPAHLNDRNDIICEKKKISGNAQFTTKNRMMSHGTILFNSDLYILDKVLDVNIGNIESKSTKSFRSKVRNIKSYIKNEMSVEQFKMYLLDELFNGFTDENKFPLDDSDWEEIYKLAESKYSDWIWNFGRSPKFNLIKKEIINDKEVSAKFYIENGLVKKIEINSNDKLFRKVENLLLEKRFDYFEISKILKDNLIAENYEEIINLIY